MSINSLMAAKHICERGNWGVTNLALQKIAYIAHMVHLGRTGLPLVYEEFEAWDYGPVLPSVYKRVRIYGSSPIQNIFHGIAETPIGQSKTILDDACDNLLSKSAAELVAMTHWENGAWAKHYRPQVLGIKIPNAAIAQEYISRVGSN